MPPETLALRLQEGGSPKQPRLRGRDSDCSLMSWRWRSGFSCRIPPRRASTYAWAPRAARCDLCGVRGTASAPCRTPAGFRMRGRHDSPGVPCHKKSKPRHACLLCQASAPSFPALVAPGLRVEPRSFTWGPRWSPGSEHSETARTRQLGVRSTAAPVLATLAARLRRDK